MNKKYPHLFTMLEMIALDNNMVMLRTFGWPEQQEPLAKFEEIAAKLSPEQKETVAAGDHDEAIVILTTIQDGMALDYFLNQAFDGKYREQFYY